MRSPALYINRDPGIDWLIALEFGRVLDGQPADHLLPVDEDAAYVLDGPGGTVIGFAVGELCEYDPDAPGREELWRGPRFDVPLFGLRDVHAGEVILGTQATLFDKPTVNRVFFATAIDTEGDECVCQWRMCLESGDAMAHFGLGYTLLDHDRPREAYGHLRAYVAVAPFNTWAWCWLGRAALAIDEPTEARDAFRRAVALELTGGDETDAAELLTDLEEERPCS